MPAKHESQITRDEHDTDLNAKKVSIVAGAVGNATVNIAGGATIFAVVNTSAAGQASVVLDASLSKIGFATVFPATAWPDPKTYIGLVTVTGNFGTTGNVTLDPGSRTGILGNLTLTDSKGFIGLTTTTVGSIPTVFAVVNTAAAGQASVVLDNSVAKIGFTTVTISSMATVTLGTQLDQTNDSVSVGKFYPALQSLASGAAGPIATDSNGRPFLADPKGFIGLVTVVGSLSPAAGNVTLDDGSLTGIIGNVTLSDAKTYIGLTTTTLGAGSAAIGKLAANSGVDIGDVDVLSIAAGDNNIGNVDVASLAGNVTLSDAKTYIGLTTTTLGVGTRFIGLVTASSLNAGTTKTWIPLPVALSTSSVVTVAVPTGGNALFYIGNLVFNSDATVRVSIKSGVTYLTGNASIGITVNPGGGWVESGSPDSPTYIGLASGAAIVVEKFDMTGTKANLGGKVNYFQE
jgi:hypothetical protein